MHNPEKTAIFRWNHDILLLESWYLFITNWSDEVHRVHALDVLHVLIFQASTCLKAIFNAITNSMLYAHIFTNYLFTLLTIA